MCRRFVKLFNKWKLRCRTPIVDLSFLLLEDVGSGEWGKMRLSGR
jgi:hypothetical protein